MALTEHLDPRLLPEYDKFTRASVAAFLEQHAAWFAEHASNGGGSGSLTGIQVNGILLPTGRDKRSTES